MIVLLDTGSSHNFLSSTVATQLNVEASSQNRVKVKVASRQSVQSRGFCKALQVDMEGFTFLIDFKILELNDYDVVIGTNWLKTLGSVV